MRRRRAFIAILLGMLLASSMAALAVGAPTSEDVEAAERRVEQLEVEIKDLEAERAAIETRIEVTDQRIVAQRDLVERSRAQMEKARRSVRLKLVAMYKARRPDPVSLLLESRTIADLVSRAVLLSRIAASDQEALRSAVLAADEAAYQMTVLNDLREQDAALRREQEDRASRLSVALAEQKALAERLGAEALAALAARQAASARDRQAWIDSSVPLDANITFVGASVEPYTGAEWLVPSFRPTAYRVSGPRYSATCSWYGNEFHGRRTASGQTFNENDFTCASNSYPFGTTLALSRKNRRIVVVVNDRGPFVWSGSSWSPHPIRKLDLSKAAAYALGFTGLAEVTIEPVVAKE